MSEDRKPIERYETIIHGSYDYVCYTEEVRELESLLQSKEAEIERLRLTLHISGKNVAICEDENRTLSSLLDKAVEVLELIERWKDAYPEDVFRPLVFNDYESMCGNAGCSVDRVSAHVMRGSVKSYSELATKILSEIKEKRC